MEHFKDNSGCSGKKKSEIFWNNSRKVQYVFAGDSFYQVKIIGHIYEQICFCNGKIFSTNMKPYRKVIKCRIDNVCHNF